MLRMAFNAIARLQSRPATLKRPGTPDIFSPVRLTPSNFFKFTKSLEYTTIKGTEFVIPSDTLTGEFSQSFVFSAVADAGNYKLKFGSLETGSLAFNASAAQIQTALRLLTGYGSVVVTAITSGFKIVFSGVSTSPDLGELSASTLVIGATAVTATFTKANIPWSRPIKTGDVIIDGSNRWSVKDIEDLHDLGASLMGYRVRVDG